MTGRREDMIWRGGDDRGARGTFSPPLRVVVSCRARRATVSRGGSAVFPESKGCLPGLLGLLNPVRDTHDRTYLNAANITIDQGRQHPVSFRTARPIRLTDAHGVELSVCIPDVVGKSALVECRPFMP